MRILSDAEVAAVLDLRRVTDALEHALRDLGHGRAASTVRVRAAADGSMASALAAIWPAGGVAGGKLYATTKHGFSFVVTLFDLDGRLLGVMEAGSLTRVRTAAGTGVAIRHLLSGRPEVVTIVGTGQQGRSHVELVANELPDVAELRIVGRRPEARDALVRYASERGLAATAVAEPATAVRDAGLVITVTAARDPLFPADSLADGALICALGATKADRQEIGSDVVERAHTVVVDSLEGSLTECGDLIAAAEAGVLAWDDVIELAELVADHVRVEGAPNAGVTLYESQGIALQDVVAAALVVEATGSERAHAS